MISFYFNTNAYASTNTSAKLFQKKTPEIIFETKKSTTKDSSSILCSRGGISDDSNKTISVKSASN